MTRTTVSLAALLLAAACTKASHDTPAAKPSDAPVAVSLAPVTDQSAPVLLTLTGMVAAEQTSNVAATVPGRVMAVLVDRGSVVKFGDPLVRLDASSAALSAQSVRAQLASAQAQEKLAAEECKRAQELLDKSAITRSQYDREITNCTAAAQAVAATKAQLGLVSKSIADGVVRAPFAGRIDGTWVRPGEYVGPGARLVTLVDDDPMHVNLSVPESYVPKVALGQEVTVTAVAYGDQTFAAKVTRLGAEVGSQTRALTVEAELAAGSKLTPGMFVEANLTLERKPMPAVPATALVYRGTTWRLFAVVAGRLEERVVQRGPVLPDGQVALLRGATTGEQVANPITEQVADGVVVGK
ncbi:MAG: efflux RND transporter periplasmic adaptor subunit [Kofleriaceae bacterium]